MYFKVGSVRPVFLNILIFMLKLAVPGDGGSQLFVKLNKTYSKHSWCEKKTSGYTNIWVNLEELAAPMIYCFVDNMV